MTNARCYTVLFLSYQSSHSEIFELVMQYLDKAIYSCHIIDVSSQDIKIPLYRLIARTRAKFVEDVLSEVRPDLLVVANDQGINAQFIKYCKMIGIPSMAIQDGIFPESQARGLFKILRIKNSLTWRILSYLSNWKPIAKVLLRIKWRPLVLDWGYGGATDYAVIGNTSKKVLETRGVKKIFVTGYPLLDEINSPTNSKDASVNVELENAVDTILFLDQPLEKDGIITKEQETSLIESIIDSIDPDKFRLVIKLHPRDELTKYHISRDKRNVKVEKDIDVLTLSKTSSIIITCFSSAALWGICLNKPLIFLDIFSTPPSILTSFGLHINDIRRLQQAITSVKNGFTYDEKSIKDVLHLLDGNASQRLANIIKEALEGRVE